MIFPPELAEKQAAFEVSCPACHAPARSYCRTLLSGTALPFPHEARHEARRALDEPTVTRVLWRLADHEPAG